MRAFWRRDPLLVLGPGVWRRCHDRFVRAVDRYHQMLEACGGGPARDSLETDGARLAAALASVYDTCVASQGQWPSAGLDIPPGSDAVHRALSQAAAAAAQASEAAAMVRVAVRSGDLDTALARAAAARRSVDAVSSKVAAAAAAAGTGGVGNGPGGRWVSG